MLNRFFKRVPGSFSAVLTINLVATLPVATGALTVGVNSIAVAYLRNLHDELCLTQGFRRITKRTKRSLTLVRLYEKIIEPSSFPRSLVCELRYPVVIAFHIFTLRSMHYAPHCGGEWMFTCEQDPRQRYISEGVPPSPPPPPATVVWRRAAIR